MNLKNYIRSIPDYPKKGILFRDITTLIKDENAFRECVNQIIERSKRYKIDKIAAIESRGFVFASAVSYILKKPLPNDFWIIHIRDITDTEFIKPNNFLNYTIKEKKYFNRLELYQLKKDGT